MATAEYSATVGTVQATAQSSNVIGAIFSAASTLDTDADAAVTAVTLVDTKVDLAVTSATTADTATGTAVTDVSTALTDLDAIATDGTSGIIHLLGSGVGGTYAYAAHQITGTADTTPAITQAQANALVAIFNTAMTAVLAAQTALNTAKTDTAAALVATTLVQTESDLAVTAATLVQTDSDTLQTKIAAENADITVYIGSVSNVASHDILHQALNAIRRVISGSNLLAVGSPTPRSP